MTLRINSVAKVLIILFSLILAFLLDQSVTPHEEFVATPFAIPVLVAIWLFSKRGLLVTISLAIVVASVSAYLDRAPTVPALYHLTSLIMIGFLASLLAEERRSTVQRAQEAEAEQARLQAIFANAFSGIFFLDARTGHVLANAEGDRIFGRPIVLEAGRAQFLDQIRYPDGRPIPFEELVGTRALRGESPSRSEDMIVRPDGSTVPVLNNAAPVRLPDGRVIGAVVISQDISDLKAAERMREEWTSLVAHDLRQPVTVISGYAHLLQNQAPSFPESAQSNIRHIVTSARLLNRMIGDLLDVSRIESRRLTLAREQLDVSTLVRDVVTRSAEITQGHPVCVEVRGPIPPVEADPARVEQVLGNLLSNAVKYGEASTDVVIDVQRLAAEVEISITNTGPGIPPEQLKKLFTRFYRTPEAQASRVAGLGVGLYICKGLVEAHGGRIWAESIPGQTTTFHFTLPIAPDGR